GHRDVLAARAGAGPVVSPLAARLAAPGSHRRRAGGATTDWNRSRSCDQRRLRPVSASTTCAGRAVTPLLSSAAPETLALLLYPGLVTVALFGLLIEIAWSAVARQSFGNLDIARRRPPTVQVIVALLAMLAAAQFAAPFNPVPAADRNLVIAA